MNKRYFFFLALCLLSSTQLLAVPTVINNKSHNRIRVVIQDKNDPSIYAPDEGRPDARDNAIEIAPHHVYAQEFGALYPKLRGKNLVIYVKECHGNYDYRWHSINGKKYDLPRFGGVNIYYDGKQFIITQQRRSDLENYPQIQ